MSELQQVVPALSRDQIARLRKSRQEGRVRLSGQCRCLSGTGLRFYGV